MKVEWLNDELDEAQLTKGWFRKYTARVIRGSAWNERINKMAGAVPNQWYYPDGSEANGLDMEARQGREWERRKLEGNWKRVTKLPKAKVV